MNWSVEGILSNWGVLLGRSLHLLLQAHPCPGSSATFSNPGKKNCGRFGCLVLLGGLVWVQARSSATCLNIQVANQGQPNLGPTACPGAEICALGHCNVAAVGNCMYVALRAIRRFKRRGGYSGHFQHLLSQKCASAIDSFVTLP